MIHREGYKILIPAFMVLLLLNAAIFLAAGPSIPAWVLLGASVGLMAFLLRFFRDPVRNAEYGPGMIYAPADGRVVVVEETTEGEYFLDRRIQVSVFMTVWDVHINWYPCEGSVIHYRYHPGKYLVAWHPKSSTLNERNTVVIRTGQGKEMLVRQIAGAVARRIISYAGEGKEIKAGDQLGFIRFGSRVDVFLPRGSKILVRPGQKVRGLLSPLAELK